MKRSLSWWVLLILAAVGYGLKYIVGGALGDVLGLFGLLMLLFAIIAGVRTIRANPKNISHLKDNKLSYIIGLVILLALIGIIYSKQNSQNTLDTTSQIAQKELIDIKNTAVPYEMDASTESSLRLQAKAKGYTPECVEAFIEYAKQDNAKKLGQSYTVKQGLPSGYECAHAHENKVDKIIDQITKENPEKIITLNEYNHISLNLPSDITQQEIKDKLLSLGFKFTY